MYVEGPYWQYLGRKDRAQYFVLRSELPENRRRRKIKDPDGMFLSTAMPVVDIFILILLFFFLLQ